MEYPRKVTVCEVGLRDGLQNEKTLLGVSQKLELVRLIHESGIRLVEIGSLVSPKAVPQMADTEQVFCGIPAEYGDTEYRVLVLNRRGIDRAAAAGMKKVKMTLSASRAHQLANANTTPEEMLDKFKDTAAYARELGITLSGAIATSFGYPVEGKIPVSDIKRIADVFAENGVSELSMSDTTGMANPEQVYGLCTEMKKSYPELAWNLHFHDAHGMGLANVLAAMEAGFSRFDASMGGIGGCPFAPNAAGNIATEDLVNMCVCMGIDTGADTERCLETARTAGRMLGRELSSATLRAGAVSYEPHPLPAVCG